MWILSYPADDEKLGHDLTALLKEIRLNCFGGKHLAVVASDLEYMKNDEILQECIRILSLFGRNERYYNLDVIASGYSDHIDPEAEWKALEESVEDPVPYIQDPQSLYRDYYPSVHSRIVSKLEQLIRAIVMQLTLGGHSDPSGDLKTSNFPFYEFIRLDGEEFATLDYPRSVEILKVNSDNWGNFLFLN